MKNFITSFLVYIVVVIGFYALISCNQWTVLETAFDQSEENTSPLYSEYIKPLQN